MKNPAINKSTTSNVLNSFTTKLKNRVLNNETVKVCLRNGQVQQLAWSFDRGYQGFLVADWGRCFLWNDDGLSTTCDAFDIMTDVE